MAVIDALTPLATPQQCLSTPEAFLIGIVSAVAVLAAYVILKS